MLLCHPQLSEVCQSVNAFNSYRKFYCLVTCSHNFLGEVCHSTDNVQQISEDNHMKIPSSCEDNHAVYLTSNDQVENLCSSAHDLAAPEKLLSVPGGLVDLSRSVVEEATLGS